MGADFWGGWADTQCRVDLKGIRPHWAVPWAARWAQSTSQSRSPCCSGTRPSALTVLAEKPLGSSSRGSPAWPVVQRQDTPQRPQQCRNEVPGAEGPLLALSWSPWLGLQGWRGGGQCGPWGWVGRSA